MKTALRFLTIVALLAATATPARAAPGDLDTSFDTDGKVTTPFGTSDFGSGMALQSDGKIVVAGQAFNGSNWDFALARYNTNGSLDTSFDGDGKVTTPFGFSEDFGQSVAVQSDGKIIVAGYSNSVSTFDFAVARYTSTGALDTSFSGDGLVSTAIGSGTDQAFSVAVQSDGKIVVAGFSFNGTNNDFALVRYNTNGTLDTSFDGDGKVTTPVGSGHDQVFSVVVQSDGSIVVAGFANNGSNDDFALARYTSTGALDTSFDTDGMVTTPFGSAGDIGRSVAMQSDGRILVAGYSNNGSNDDFALARYTSAGALDTSFDTDGKVTTSFGSAADQGFGVAVQPNGKIVVAGFFFSGGIDYNDFAVARYTSTGALDTSFSGDGKVTTPVGGGSFQDASTCVVVQTDGKIVAAGHAYGGNYDFGVVRYSGDPLPPAVTLSTATAITTTGATLNGTVNPNGVTTTAQFQYGTTISYGSTASVTLSPNNGTTAQSVSAAITGLTQNTLYHFRLTATNAGGTSNTTDGTFTTLAVVGDLDTTFDTDGKVTTPFGTSDFGNGMALQSDGKIIVAGQTFNGSNWDFALARYTTTGALDTSFDTDGKVTTPFGFSEDFGQSVAVQSDGKIIVAGYSNSVSTFDFAVARYTSTGALDTSFSGDGLVSTAIGSGTDQAFSVAVQSDGKIVVAGFSFNGTNNDFALVRYNTNGTLDTSFDGDGKVTTPLGTGHDQVFSVVMQSDGSIVVAGFSNNGTNDDFALARYMSTGALDTSFDTDGMATTPFGSGLDIGRGVALQSDGSIVVAGYSNNGSNDDFALARYTSAGALDTGFGTGGKVTTAFDSGVDQGFGVAVQPNGKIIVAGYSFSGVDNNMALARFTSAGALDTSFSGDGKVTTDYGFFHDAATCVVVQADGKIVAAGHAYISNYDFGVVRYSGDPLPPAVTLSAATAITTTGATLNGTVNPNGVAATAQFEYGPTISYGSTAGVTLSPNNSVAAQSVSATPTALTPGTLYHYRLSATNAVGTSNTTDGTFTTLTTYQEWAAANGLTGGNSGPNDDFDGDAKTNMEEWAFGTNPTVNSAGAIVVTGGVINQRGSPTVSVQNIPNSVDFRAVFGRRKDYITVGLTYTVQFSADLSIWVNNTTTPTVIADDGTIEACTVPYPFFVNGKKARFFRVSLSVTP